MIDAIYAPVVCQENYDNDNIFHRKFHIVCYFKEKPVTPL